MHKIETLDGTTVIDDLKEIGYYSTERPGDRKLDSFIETHIEQGPILENEEKTIGVVDRIQGAFAAEVFIMGEDGHGGTVPLSARRDACLGAAEMVVFLNQLALNTDELAKMTVGTLKTIPDSISTIPGEAYFTIDCRHPDAVTLASLRSQVESGLHEIARKRDLECKFKIMIEMAPVVFDEKIVALIEESTKAVRYPYNTLLTRSGKEQICLLHKQSRTN